MSIKRHETRVTVPAGARFTVAPGLLRVEGPLGRTERTFPTDALALAAAGPTVTLTLKIPPNRRAAQALLGTWAAHVANLAGGVTRGCEARMKVVAAHFPMKVSVKESTLLIENFLGEKHPRTAPLLPGVKATVDGEFVVLSGHDVERVGQAAANIERATRIRDYDPRVFQDGIYLVDYVHLKEAA
ncbi:MAG TPA: 50S ribosomal protein L6 [Thermoplasmata archaeon]|nr:50S ribosomal protein L6 [Thermoplasmata archaeon]